MKKIMILIMFIIGGIVTLGSINYLNPKYLECEESLNTGENKNNMTNNIENKIKNNTDATTIFTSETLPQNVIDQMTGISWETEAPVTLEDLRYVTISYWGFDDESHLGELVVHQSVSEDIVAIFKELYDAKFPIEKMRLIDVYGGDDELSMADNNSSAFNYRKVPDSDRLSNHSFGLAIDINPVQNPYIKEGVVLPELGTDYLDRSVIQKGMILKDDVVYNAFVSRGWTWGGDWNTLKDYQHFDKKLFQ